MKGKITPGMLQVGFSGVGTIDSGKEYSIVSIAKGSSLVIGGRVSFGAGSKISIGSEARIEFEGNAVFTGRTELVCHKGMKFGSGLLVSWDCIFMDTDFHKIFQENMELNPPQEICVGKNVWIGCRATLLKGVRIADGCVVGAGSVVAKDLSSSNSIYAGNPARKIKENIDWNI